jgi:hypothetical protein
MEFTDTTEAFAKRQGAKAQTVRKRLCETGSYFGVTPLKLANRRLLWPAVIVTASGVRHAGDHAPAAPRTEGRKRSQEWQPAAEATP